MNGTPNTIKIIATLGLIPFFLGTAATFDLFPQYWDAQDFLIRCSVLYAGLILSFLGGCLFAFECLDERKQSKFRLWLAIAPSIWSLIAIQIPNFSASILAFGFLLVYELDRKANSAGITPPWWLSLRMPLTAAVTINLAIIGFHHGS